MKKIEQEAEEYVMKNEVDIFIVKMKMEIVINKSLCEEVEFLRFCFFFVLKEKNNCYYIKPRLNNEFITNFSNKE